MPHWEYTIRLADVFRNDGMTFEERRDAIVRRIRASRWFSDSKACDGPLSDLVDELAAVRDTGEFDAVWNAIYDLADADRAWIATV